MTPWAAPILANAEANLTNRLFFRGWRSGGRRRRRGHWAEPGLPVRQHPERGVQLGPVADWQRVRPDDHRQRGQQHAVGPRRRRHASWAGSDNDTLTGGADNDALNGGAGTDTAVFTQAINAGMITASGGGWQVAAGGAEATDTLTDVEIVDGLGGGKFLLVGNGGYATIAAAYADAVDGDTIVLAAGTYTENLVVNKDITIVGANQGVDGALHANPASIIAGTLTITLATGQVKIDGVQINNTSDNATQFKGIVVAAGANVTIENSRFHSTGANGNNGDRGIELQTGATGTILIDDNFFGGVQDGPTNRTSTANWTSGVWSDGSSTSLTITGNTFDSVRTGINLDGYDDGISNVSANTFVDSGTGISIGTPSGNTVTGIHDNTFTDVGTDFNLQNVTTSQTFNLDATNNTASDVMVVLGGTETDTLTGTDGVDILIGTGLNFSTSPQFPATDNVLKGGAANDVLYGDVSDTLPTPNPTAPDEADVAVYDATLTAASFATTADADSITTGSQAGWTVTPAGPRAPTVSSISRSCRVPIRMGQALRPAGSCWSATAASRRSRMRSTRPMTATPS